MNAAAFPNFIRKSDEDGPKYWEVLQTGTFHRGCPTLRIDLSFYQEFIGKVNRIYLSGSSRSFYFERSKVFSESFFLRIFLFRKFAQHMK